MSAVGAQGHWAGLGYGQCACVTQLNVVLCVGCELFFSVLLVLALLARGTCADPAALAAWLGGRAAVEKRLPNQGMCCLFYTQNHPLVDWAGCGLLVARCAGCSHACVAKYFAGKKCVVCVWQFGALLVWWVGNQLFDACLWSYHGNTRGRAGLCQGAATRSMVTVRNLLKK